MGRVDLFGKVYDGLLYGFAINGDFKNFEIGLERSRVSIT